MLSFFVCNYVITKYCDESESAPVCKFTIYLIKLG